MVSEQTGYMHSFETFGTLDGPGIRSVVFLQGCRFRCLYCHNPDTWEEKTGTVITADALCSRIVRYKPYFEASGGGVTVSGGEPLLQAPFVTQLFKKLRCEGVHTCLDTSGYTASDIEPAHVEELLSYTDLVLLDIKHINSDAHRILTGKSNHETICFAHLLERLDIPVWLRYVVVPGYTDDLKDIRSFKDFAASLSNIRKIEYLPFHKLGEYKWRESGLTYRLGNVLPPDPKLMELIQNT